MGATGKRDEHAILGAFIGCGTYWEGNSCFSPLFFPILSTVDKNLRLRCMGLPPPPLSFCNIVEKKKKKKINEMVYHTAYFCNHSFHSTEYTKCSTGFHMILL